MKKIVIILIVCLFSMSVFASVKQNIIDTRGNLGTSLSETVKELKKQIKPVDTDVNNANTDIKKLLETATKLKNRSVEGEINPTVLDHGRSTVDKCELNEELFWNGFKFDCRSVNASIDCETNNGELKKDNICYQPESYNLKDLGWGPCQDIKSSGESHTELDCTFINKEDNTINYQVENEKCSSIPLYNNICKKYGVDGSCSQVKQACGRYGANSSCKCPGGTTYYYDKTKTIGYCLEDVVCSDGFSFENGRCIKAGEFKYSAAAGGYSHKSITKHFDKVPLHFLIDVWTEDLISDVKFTSDKGQVLFYRHFFKWSPGRDYVTRHGYSDFVVNEPGTLYVYVKEDGSAPSDNLGYSIKFVDDVGSKCNNPKGIYNEEIQKCMNPVPICAFK